MTERELNITLREMARNAGLCDQWYEHWKDDDTIDDCLERYVNGFDFSLEHDWISNAFIKAHFSGEQLHRHHIYIDEVVDFDATSGDYIFLGKCGGTVRVGGFSVTSLYVRHESNVKVIASDFAKVHVSTYEGGEADCQQQDAASVKAYKH